MEVLSVDGTTCLELFQEDPQFLSFLLTFVVKSCKPFISWSHSVFLTFLIAWTTTPLRMLELASEPVP